MNTKYQSHVMAVIIFLSALFCTIMVTAPGLQINDEWITTNQLNQLAIGHQVVNSEGKYGNFLNQATTPYFETRGNILGYALALPMLSLPVFFLFSGIGDLVRFFILFIWVVLPTLILLLVIHQYTDFFQKKTSYLLIPVCIFSLFLFYTNLQYYYPFSIIGSEAPIEVLSVIFTDQILFSFLAVIIFFTCYTIFSDTRYSLSGTITILACSSYLYWATSAKDHMLTTVGFSLGILFFIRYFQRTTLWDGVTAFFCTGLLLWIRPEVGFSTCILLTGFFYIRIILLKYHSNKPGLSFTDLLIPFTIFLGAIPFFINNYIMSGNFLYPLFLKYNMNEISPAAQEILNTGMSEISTPALAAATPVGGTVGLPSLLTFIQRYYSFSPDTIQGTFGILFAPLNGSFSVTAICPLLLPGVLMFLVLFGYRRSLFTSQDRNTIPLLLLFILTIFLAYMKAIPSMNISEGIGPDIRYLSPLYIPAGLLGLLCLHRSGQLIPYGTLIKRCILFPVIIPIPLILILLLTQPFGGGYYVFVELLSYVSYVIAILLFLFFLLNIAGVKTKGILSILFPVLISIPFTWQIMIVILYSITKFNGYPFWLPLIEHVINSIFMPIG